MGKRIGNILNKKCSNMEDEFNKLKWYKETLDLIIKPCPLCGNKEIKIDPHNLNGNQQVQCYSCGLRIEKVINCDENVVILWNKRTN